MESGARVDLDPHVAAATYGAGMRDHQRRLERACRNLQVDLVEVGTDEPFQKILSRVMQKRKRLY
jgi:hypothetical protein